MFDVLSGQYKNLASKGRYGDTMLAHINPQEAGLLRSMGGAGSVNPQTGLREFYNLDPRNGGEERYQAPFGTYDMRGGGPSRPEPFDRKFADVQQGGMGVYKVTGYTVPTDDKKYANIPLEAKYDPKGNFQFYTLKAGEAITPDPNQPNIISVPRIDAEGKVTDWGISDTNNQDNGSFGSFIRDIATEFGPMILAGLAAYGLAGSNILSGFGNAAGGVTGAAAETLGPYAAQAAGAYGGSTAAAAAAAAGSLTGIQAATAAQNAVNLGIPTGSGAVTPPTGSGTTSGSTAADITEPLINPNVSTTTTGSGSPMSGVNTSTTTGATTTAADAATTVAGNVDKANIFGAAGYGAPATAAELASATSIFSGLGDAGSSLLKFVKENPGISGSVLGSIVSAVGAANAPTSQTTTSSIDPQIRAEYLANLQRAKDTAAGLNTRTFQDFTPDYQLASQQVKNLGLGGIGQQTTNKAAELALLEAGFTPQQIQAANAGKASLANATGYTAAQIAAAQANRANVANVASGAGSQYMSAYQNPYEQQVVQGTLGDIERSRLMQEQANMAQATAAKAFGGSRQGIVSGMTNEAALRQAATSAAQLRSAGFTQAAQLGQTDAARALQAQLANQGIDVTLEQANAQLSQQGLLSNQAATNQASQFGAGATNQANLSNAAALNQMAQYNASMQQQAALANQAAYAQGATIRQSAIGQLGQLGAQQQNLGLAGANAVMEDQIRQQALAQARLDAERNIGVERLGITSGALGLQPANLGGTTSQPLYNNTAGSLLSGGLTGAYIGSLLGK